MLEATIPEARVIEAAPAVAPLDPRHALETLIEEGGDYHAAAAKLRLSHGQYLAILAGSGTVPVAEALQTIGLLSLVKKLFSADLLLDVGELTEKERANFYLKLLAILPTLTAAPKSPGGGKGVPPEEAADRLDEETLAELLDVLKKGKGKEEE